MMDFLPLLDLLFFCPLQHLHILTYTNNNSVSGVLFLHSYIKRNLPETTHIYVFYALECLNQLIDVVCVTSKIVNF